MPKGLGRLTEQQIQKALAEGKLKNLEGEGKPLPEHPEAAVVDGATLAGHRIMAEAGALPEEFRLRDQVAALRKAAAAATEGAEKKAAMVRLAEAEMRLAIAVEARRKFLSR